MISFFENVASATGVDKAVHLVTDGERVVDRDADVKAVQAVTGAVVSGVEDVFHATGADTCVHAVTGGKRILERDGRISPQLVKEIEDAFKNCGLDKLVHLFSSGQRCVNLDGTLNIEGMIKCAKSICELCTNPGVVGPTRVIILAIDEATTAFVKQCYEFLERNVKAARKAKENVKKSIESFENIHKWIRCARKDFYSAAPELPGIVSEFKTALTGIKDSIADVRKTVEDIDNIANGRR